MPADQFLTLDGRPAVRVQRDFPHPIEQVWRAVTTPEHLAQWFPSPVELDLRPGGQLRFGGPDGDPSDAGTIEVVEPPRRLVFTWGADQLAFELAPTDGGTTFTLVHRFDDRYGAASFATGWELCLAGLRNVLVGAPPPPPGRGIARHEALVREFHLDEPEVSWSGGRWALRVERQLTCPAEVAWDLWFGVDQRTGRQRRAPGVGQALTPYQAPEVVLGTVTEVAEPRLLAFDVAADGGPGDHVRLELGEGTGHGARLVLTVNGQDPDELPAAVDGWGTGAVGHLAAMAAEWAAAQPVGA